MTGLTAQDREAIAPFRPDRRDGLARNLTLAPHWSPGGRGFWYRAETVSGPEYRTVTAATGAQAPAFDHAALRAALPEGSDFAALEILSLEPGVTFRAGAQIWHWDGASLTPRAPRPNAPDELPSPDGTLVLLRRAGDLWLREVATGEERRLTDSAEAHFEWAKSPDQSLETIHIARQGLRLPPVAIWSPDSRRIFTHQLDERAVRVVPLVQNIPDDGSYAPQIWSLRNAFTGDPDESLPMAHQAVIEVETGEVRPLRPVHVTETSLIERREAWWSADSARLFYVDHDRFETKLTLCDVDAATGTEREVLAETSASFAEVNPAFGALPNIRLLDRTGEVVWFSQSDGWGHLSLHDLATGARKARITRGDWTVCDLLHVDEDRREAIVLAGSPEDGPDPYLRRILAAPLDGGPARVLAEGAGDHGAHLREVGWPDLLAEAERLGSAPAAVAPDGAHLVETLGTFDALPRHVLRRTSDGAVVAELGEAKSDINWPLPERLTLTAADGATRLFGLLWQPEGPAPEGGWPLVDMVYPGPQCIQTPRAALTGEDLPKLAMAAALTRLGFAVLMMDGRGTPYRSKPFHDLCHGNLGDPGFLSDHVAAIRALCAERPALDAGRVGIIGHSAGGHAAARAILEYPGVFHAAVATAGSHESRAYNRCWPEKWQGPLVVAGDGSSSHDAVANAPLAHRLEGALFLGHGDMDENVLPAVTLRLARALDEAGKRYELMIAAGKDHATFKTDPAAWEAQLDFLVRHLAPR
ncbi:S9 family peptidase [Pseudoroseicyclus aestuarii]|uniref:Dipeptidyl aminopeptidase/acylaminoacyl peptidase n=1 Tax=Pseudoroseicyclus aestuarii TaxID=1795041 RepID=A0A318ST83_9RHOB|nr:prolyl oligopeptidase family serine peptidase [Pseudoroseicyclus aestuarii]PYE82379.1 dipeptidyl aminopeptidase/acylaminoacyl peptidase [Pseudoroseicyclus aestuarii]